MRSTPPKVLAEPLTPHRDNRGFLFEPLGAADLSSQKNIHLAWTTPGSIRGNHYHLRGTEVAVVLGPALVRYRDTTGSHDVRVPGGALWRFVFPPRVEHAYGAIGPEPMLLVGFNSEAYEPDAPDVVAAHLLEPGELGSQP